MNEIKFIYNKNETSIKYKENENIISIIDKFCKQNNLNKNEISFIMQGKLLDTLNLNY